MTKTRILNRIIFVTRQVKVPVKPDSRSAVL